MIDEIDWGKVHGRLLGYSIELNEPPAELLVIQKAVGVLASSFLKKGKSVSKQIKVLFRTSGLSSELLPIFLFKLRSRTLVLPPMETDQARGLSLALNLLLESGRVPDVSVDPDFVVDSEHVFDSVLLALGDWGRTKLLAEFLREYCKVLKAFDDDLARASSLDTMGYEEAILSACVTQEIRKRPFNYQYGHLLKQATELAFF